MHIELPLFIPAMLVASLVSDSIPIRRTWDYHRKLLLESWSNEIIEMQLHWVHMGCLLDLSLLIKCSLEAVSLGGLF